MKMSSSLTVAFSGTTPVLQCNFLPEITLDANFEYSCALLDLFIDNKQKFNLNEIVNLKVLHIECDIISDSYINGEPKHVIHQFATGTARVKGGTFVEAPNHLIYFPIKTKNLRSIQISLHDHNGKLINFNGGEIFCRINIKREISSSENSIQS